MHLVLETHATANTQGLTDTRRAMALTQHGTQAASAKNTNKARESSYLLCRSTEATENRSEMGGEGVPHLATPRPECSADTGRPAPGSFAGRSSSTARCRP